MTALLVVVTALFIVIGAVLIQRARKDMLGEPDRDRNDPRAVFRDAYDRGQMNEAEYQRILESLNRGDDVGLLLSNLRNPAKPVESDPESPTGQKSSPVARAEDREGPARSGPSR